MARLSSRKIKRLYRRRIGQALGLFCLLFLPPVPLFIFVPFPLQKNNPTLVSLERFPTGRAGYEQKMGEKTLVLDGEFADGNLRTVQRSGDQVKTLEGRLEGDSRISLLQLGKVIGKIKANVIHFEVSYQQSN
jgi:hypothetical protein